MKVAVNANGVIESSHLPPVEQSYLLSVDRKGKVVATDKLPPPVDEYGIPNVSLYLGSIASTLSREYVPPEDNNVHHLVYPRSEYRKKGIESVPFKFRESPSLMLGIATQIHNYGHWVMEPLPRPSLEVMSQWVHEQDQINKLFKIGRSVIASERWLRSMFGQGTQSYRTAERYTQHYESSETEFYDYLDECKDAQLGLMPNRQNLSDMGVEVATRYLGTLAAARSMARQRHGRMIIQETE